MLLLTSAPCCFPQGYKGMSNEEVRLGAVGRGDPWVPSVVYSSVPWQRA